jgi:hypothetical protein
MLRRLSRIFVFAMTTATLWLVALPAFASGPLCDDRGATRIAPNPTMVTPEQSLDIAFGDDLSACFDRMEKAGFHGSRAPAEITTSIAADAALPVRARAPWSSRLASDSPESSVVPASEVSARARPGIRTRVERPPRH